MMGRMGRPAGPGARTTERVLAALKVLEVPGAMRESMRAYDALRAQAKALKI